PDPSESVAAESRLDVDCSDDPIAVPAPGLPLHYQNPGTATRVPMDCSPLRHKRRILSDPLAPRRAANTRASASGQEKRSPECAHGLSPEVCQHLIRASRSPRVSSSASPCRDGSCVKPHDTAFLQAHRYFLRNTSVNP